MWIGSFFHTKTTSKWSTIYFFFHSSGQDMYGQLRHSDIFSMSVTSYLKVINAQKEKKCIKNCSDSLSLLVWNSSHISRLLFIYIINTEESGMNQRRVNVESEEKLGYLQCLSSDDWMVKTGYIYTTECISAITKEMVIFSGDWWN